MAKNLLPADYDDDWDANADHPPFVFGQNSSRKRKSSVMVDIARESRLRDDRARELKVEEYERHGVLQLGTRPVLPLSTMQEWLHDKEPSGYFHLELNVVYLDQRQDKYRLTDHVALSNLVQVIDKYRIMSLDTENKSGKIFLIVGDIEGNCVFFNDATNVPVELANRLNDVGIYKIQSNIEEDYGVLKNVGLTVTGIADTQSIAASFIDPGGNLGTHNQALLTGHPARPFLFNRMSFKHRLNRLSFLHAISDCRQPFLTLFRAVELRALSLPIPLTANDDCYKLIWDTLNRVAGVPLSVAQHGRPNGQTVDQNWETGRSKEFHDRDINNKERVSAIERSQKDWPVKYDKLKVKKVFRTMRSEEEKFQHNRRTSAAYKLRKRYFHD